MTADAKTISDLAGYVQASAQDAYLILCATEALEAVTEKITEEAIRPVPQTVKARAVLEYGAEQFHRRQSRNGIAGLDGMDMTPMRIARDPMKAALPYLQKYLKPAIA